MTEQTPFDAGAVIWDQDEEHRSTKRRSDRR